MSINPRDCADDYPNNSDRADWAANALSLFCEETGLEPEIERRESVSDLLCNLGHYCDRHDLDFLAIASSALGVWDAEKREEQNGEADAIYPEKRVIIAVFDPNSN
jgi:hypothetical protein